MSNLPFQSLKSALRAENTMIAREVMLKRLLDLGIGYDDFYIAYIYWPEKERWLATLRTTGSPLPSDIYDSVIAAFNQAFPSSYRNFLSSPAEVCMVDDDALPGSLISLSIEHNCYLAFKCEEMFMQMEFLNLEISGWRQRTGDESTLLCWPRVCEATGRTVIIVSMHTQVSFQVGTSIFEPARAFIRSLPEYRYLSR